MKLFFTILTTLVQLIPVTVTKLHFRMLVHVYVFQTLKLSSIQNQPDLKCRHEEAALKQKVLKSQSKFLYAFFVTSNRNSDVRVELLL